MISFFFRVRDIPPRFISLDLIFLDTFWSDLSDFCINTQTVSQSIIFQIFGGQIFFRQVISEKKSIFGFFLVGKGYIFESSLYIKLGNANVFALIDGTPIS